LGRDDFTPIFGQVKLDDGQIRSRIAPDQTRRDLFAVVKRADNPFRPSGDMVIGHGISIGRNDDPGSHDRVFLFPAGQIVDNDRLYMNQRG